MPAAEVLKWEEEFAKLVRYFQFNDAISYVWLTFMLTRLSVFSVPGGPLNLADCQGIDNDSIIEQPNTPHFQYRILKHSSC